MKLLLYTPTYENGLRAECRESVLGQQTGHVWEWVLDSEDPFPAPDHRNVLVKYQRGRRMALDGGFDALVTVEHDMVLPPDALEKLASTTQAGVVYAPYVLRHGAAALNTWQYIGPQNLGMPLGLYPHELQRYREAGVGRICGCGWGCTLIWRNVLERVAFHDGGGTNPPGDIQFAMDCLRAGVVAFGRFDAPCGHFDDDGRLLMPYADAPPMARVEALEAVNVFIAGNSTRLVPGMRYTVTQREAWDLVRAGYVRVRQTEPETATAPPVVEEAALAAPERAVAAGQRRRNRKAA